MWERFGDYYLHECYNMPNEVKVLYHEDKKWFLRLYHTNDDTNYFHDRDLRINYCPFCGEELI
jgi:hypothetical protein